MFLQDYDAAATARCPKILSGYGFRSVNGRLLGSPGPATGILRMLIVCPNCATSYAVEPATLGRDGRVVRCSRCQTMWFAAPQTAIVPVTDVPTVTVSDSPAVSDDAHHDVETTGDERPLRGADGPVDATPPEIDAPPLAPALAPADGEANAGAEDVENFTARRQRLQARRKKRRTTSRWTAILLLLFAANVALIGARSEVVRYVPQTASLFAAIGLPVNLRHLNFEDMHLTRQTVNGVPVLIVEGRIVSVASRPVEVPRLRFAARSTTGQEIYSWLLQPGSKELEPGGALPFRSELASPPQDTRDITVRFFRASDALR